jgi:hypothetical protein
MRKTIIVILTIFIILGFSSCDALLEGFFPEFAEETATLEIYADVGFFTPDSSKNTKPIYLVIAENGGENKTLSIKFTAENGTLQESITVPRKNYSVWICLDMNDNKIVDTPGDYSDYAAYFYDSANDTVYDNCDLTNPDISDNVSVGIYLGEMPIISAVPDNTNIPTPN